MLRVALIALAHCVASTTVDLSQDWVVATDANAEAALDAVVQNDILAYSLVHGGKIIAEYYRDGRDASDTAAIWSVTKSWTSLLIGTLVKDGRLARQTTLREVFVDLDWSAIEDGDAKKTITIEDLLQMESGYTEDGGYLGHVLIRDIDGPTMTAASMESCRFAARRSPGGRLWSVVDVRERLHRVRHRHGSGIPVG